MDIRGFFGSDDNTIINERIEELENLLVIEKNKIINQKHKKTIIKQLDQFKTMFGEELFVNVVNGYMDYNFIDDEEDVEVVALSILNDKDLKFYEEHFPKRAGKFGVVGVTYRKPKDGKPQKQPWKFYDYSWLTKKKIYRAFTTKTQAIGFANGVWNKYPTEAYHMTISK